MAKVQKTMEQVLAENEQLRVQIAELCAALKPFAESADDWEFLQARGEINDITDVIPLRIDPYRAARTAITKVETANDTP